MALSPQSRAQLFHVVLAAAPEESIPALQKMIGDMARDGQTVEQQALALADVLADGLRYGTWPIIVPLRHSGWPVMGR